MNSYYEHHFTRSSTWLAGSIVCAADGHSTASAAMIFMGLLHVAAGIYAMRGAK